MQKNSEFFRKIATNFMGVILIGTILLSGCTRQAQETTQEIAHEIPSATKITTLPLPTERPITTPHTPDPPPTPAGEFRWTPYAFDRLEGDYRADAIRLADAILHYEDEVNMSAAHAQVLCDNFAFEFPPSALTNLSAENDRVKITYLFSRDAHEKKIEQFSKNVNLALARIKQEDSELTRAIKLYDYVVKNVTYFYTDYTDKDITAFSAFTQGVTICYGFADAFGYLLRQTGMKAHLWRGGTYTVNGFSEHGWCYAQIDGVYYHFDPTWEYSARKNSGKNQYIYFGLSDTKRFGGLSRSCVSGFGQLEEKCNSYGAPGSLEIELES